MKGYAITDGGFLDTMHFNIVCTSEESIKKVVIDIASDLLPSTEDIEISVSFVDMKVFVKNEHYPFFLELVEFEII